MRYHTSSFVSPTVGMVKLPEVIPLYCWNGCVWMLWWKSIVHSYALAGSVPSSVSLAEPLKDIVSPALYIVPLTGVSIQNQCLLRHFRHLQLGWQCMLLLNHKYELLKHHFLQVSRHQNPKSSLMDHYLDRCC
jgi:hypothetical protein